MVMVLSPSVQRADNAIQKINYVLNKIKSTAKSTKLIKTQWIALSTL